MTSEPTTATAAATVYGYPRQGPDRELKKAVEGYWKGRVTADALREQAAALRRANWRELAAAGLGELPTGDFSLYDHVLDTSVMVGAVPERHRAAVAADPLDGYFAMARGSRDAAPLEMTKWFDTNYHYLVPELGPDTVFTADSARQVAEFREAADLGLTARPVLVGPVTYLLLAKAAPGTPADFDPLSLLDRLLPVYAEVLADLRAAGAGWVQLDEPALVQDRTPRNWTPSPAPTGCSAGRTTARSSWSPPTSGGSARPCPSWPAPRSRDSPSTSPSPAPPTWPTSPPRAGCPASGWSPASSAAATSGSTTWRSPSPRWEPCSASPAGSMSPPPAPCCTSPWTPPPSAAPTRRSSDGSPSPARRPPNSSSSPAASPTAPAPSPPNSPRTGRPWHPAQGPR